MTFPAPPPMTSVTIPARPTPPPRPAPGPSIGVYPCDYGMSNGPRGFHHFEANEHGTVCRNCGAKPKEN